MDSVHYQHCTFPPEILTTIFQHGYICARNINYQPFSVSISQVSRAWRNAALALPSLWSCIDVRVPVEDLGATPAHAVLFIARSREHPLDIRFICSDTYLEERELASEITTNLFRRHLIPQVHRWGTFTADVSGYSFAHTIFTLLSGVTAPKLKSLQLYVRPISMDMDVDDLHVSVFTNLPNLHTVRLHGLTLDHCSMPLQWAEHVKNFSVDIPDSPWAPSMRWSSLTLSMKTAMSITHLSFDGIVVYWPSENNFILDLPTLVSLSLGTLDFDAESYVTQLVTYLRTPNLETLIIRNAKQILKGIVSTILTHSLYPCLRTLQLIRVVDHLPLEMINAFPGLIHLTLTTCYEDFRSVLEAANRSGALQLWKNLRNLHLPYCSPSTALGIVEAMYPLIPDCIFLSSSQAENESTTSVALATLEGLASIRWYNPILKPLEGSMLSTWRKDWPGSLY